MLHDLLKSGKIIEGENIWRAQIVFLASALDFYMHELTKYGLCEIYNENWERTDKYENLQVNMTVHKIVGLLERSVSICVSIS